MSEPRERDMIAFRLQFRGRKAKIVLALLHSWSGRPDAHARAIDSDLNVYRVYVDSVAIVEGHEELRDSIEKRLRERRGKAKRAAPAASPVDTAAAEPQRTGYPSPHDIPYRIADEANGDIGRALWRYVGPGGYQRAWMAHVRERQPQYFRNVVLPMSMAGEKANLKWLLRQSGKDIEKGRGKP